jgi:hypothetical protein
MVCAPGTQMRSGLNYQSGLITDISNEEGITNLSRCTAQPLALSCDSARRRAVETCYAADTILGTFALAAGGREQHVTIQIRTSLEDRYGSFLHVQGPTNALTMQYNSTSVEFHALPDTSYPFMGGLPSSTAKPWSNLATDGSYGECSPKTTFTLTVTCTDAQDP